MKYKRILLKLSGESLMGNENYGIDYNMLSFYSKQIKLISKKIQIAIVIGGGNIYRAINQRVLVLIEFKVIIWECLQQS